MRTNHQGQKAAASSLSHARKARTLADSRRFFAQTKQ